MIFWSLACASHGIAAAVIMLAASRLLLGMGEGAVSRGDACGGRMVSRQRTRDGHGHHQRRHRARRGGRAAAHRRGHCERGMVRHRTLAVGLFITGAFGLLWTVWWWRGLRPPGTHPRLSRPSRHAAARSDGHHARPAMRPVPCRHAGASSAAKFLTDAAWYFYMFWLPKYLLDARGFDIKGGRRRGVDPLRRRRRSGVSCGGGLLELAAPPRATR